jgi:hypothetical protein
MENKGGYVFSSFSAIVIIIVLIFIINALTNVNKYKHDWEKHKCNPGVIPIAGYIKRESGMSPSEFTKKNYKECYSKITKEVADEASVAYKASMGATEKTFGKYGNTLSSVVGALKNMKNISSNIFSYIINSLINMLSPIFKILLNIKSLTGKINALFKLIAYYSYTVIYSFRAFFGSFLQLIIAFLVIMAGSIAAMWIIPFGFIPATAATIMFMAISIPLGLVALGLKDLNIKHDKMPRKPGKRHGCFQKDTLINNIPINKLNIGDKIGENNYVTALFKFSATGLDVYNLYDIIVTSRHKVKDIKNKWIYVKDHPHAVKIDYGEPYVYCINTSQKVFEINDLVFLDWDEIDTSVKHNIENKIGCFNRFLIGGFNYDASVRMNDNTYKTIDNIAVNDMLYNDNKVLGIIIIEPMKIYKYTLGNETFKASEHIYTFNKSNTVINRIKSHSNVVYHLLTEQRNFYVNNTLFHDYDYALEKYL